MKFRSRSDYSHTNSSPTGSRLRNTYQKVVGSDGTSRLERVGVEDVYDSIQKAANGNTIEDLLRRAKLGDVSAIKPPVDSFADVSAAPKDLLEAHSQMQTVTSKFNSLPAEVKAKFGNSIDTFISCLNDGSYITRLSTLKPAASTTTTSEGGSENA